MSALVRPRPGPLHFALRLAPALALVGLGWGCHDGEKDPWEGVPARPPPVDHGPLITAELTTGPEVTEACAACHPDAAREVMATSHWTWKEHAQLPGREEPMAIGKANLLNNFCIGVEPNLPYCTNCHAGYGWKDDSFDFDDETRVDCLVCHDRSGTYAKKPGGAGLPADGVDLTASARSVGRPTRANCGMCHFDGGGGDAVKHGDLDRTLVHPTPRIDVHMGKHDLLCVDCHKAPAHQIQGRSMSVSVTDDRRVYCTDCHAATPHENQRLDDHTEAIACTTCHIPLMAVETPTKMTWDWSTAGRDDMPEDVHNYLKRKGSFTYDKAIPPEYRWYNGLAKRHVYGDQVVRDGVTRMNAPLGDISDPTAKIWPFKIHRGKQPYDAENGYFIAPKTAGPEGFWSHFDWNRALADGAEAMGLEYSGKYAFAETEMYWPLAHMVSPNADALRCRDCHGPGGRMNWEALGYGGDPAERGSRRANAQLGTGRDRGTR